MIAILSSAKTLDFAPGWRAPKPTLPECLDDAKRLMASLRPLAAKDLAKLLGVSSPIAQLNAERNRSFSLPHTSQNAKPALLAYKGDVYRGLRADAFTDEDLQFAQRTLRVISGLYGVLRPLDLIQPYRLEMATRLSGASWDDLYDYWSDRVTQLIARDSAADGNLVVNLASQEYSRVLRREQLPARILTLTFKQRRGGKVEMVPILAKRARGVMARFLVLKRVTDPEQLKAFADDGYRFSADASTNDEWVFVRSAP